MNKPNTFSETKKTEKRTNEKNRMNKPIMYSEKNKKAKRTNEKKINKHMKKNEFQEDSQKTHKTTKKN